ncbi:TrbI/VirB10 family protein [uncultured Tateyamaria sp.]|uniref:TrbI/VirB10 family protein n=1 Tax=uncultured Tateyamaria sp. TaxID=455651 RepID=UPI002618E624|nr:TrbI/VirB10 family protein [uncultured Tateyamaria sp.]
MADEQQDQIQQRVAAISGRQTEKPRGNRPAWAIPAFMTVVGAIGGAWTYGYLANRPEPVIQADPMPETSTASEFQAGLSGLQSTESPSAPLGIREDNTDELARLQATISALETQIAQLRDNPEVQTVQDEAALEALRAELDSIRTDLETSQGAIEDQERLLADRDRELHRARAELETERLLRDQGNAEAQRLAAEEARRREELERKRAEAEQLEREKINSPIVAWSANGKSGSAAEDAQQRYSGDEAFRRAGSPVSVTQSEIIANPSNTVVQGTLIEGTLETGILSSLAGDIAANVTYDVWSFDMSRVLIPRGSKLFGRYNSDVGIGQKRVLVVWDRVVTTDGQSVQMSAYGGDRLGRSGLPGKVDNHFLERFGSAALISVIGAVPEIVANQSDNETTTEVIENVGGDFESAVDDVIADYLSIPPTISVDQGAVVMVRVNTDLELF